MNPKNKKPTLTPHRLTKPFRPIILCFVLTLLGTSLAFAQISGSIAMEASYSDNVFGFSDYDLDRFDNGHPSFDFAKTSDDLSATAIIDVHYPIQYKWWLITPSIKANLSQNTSNMDKYRNDVVYKLQIDRYHWNASAQYGYNPHIYVRNYSDTDGTNESEQFSYEKNTLRADFSFRATRKATLRFVGSIEEYFYNQFWTEFDGTAKTIGLGVRYNFPLFIANGMYHYRVFENDFDPQSGRNDSSYESDKYVFDLNLKKMPLNNSKDSHSFWNPTFSLSYEQRFYQGVDSWYGGRIDNLYNTKGGIQFTFSPKWNLSLDYSHIFRNVDSPNESVLLLKEYTENRLSTSVEYKF